MKVIKLYLVIVLSSILLYSCTGGDEFVFVSHISNKTDKIVTLKTYRDYEIQPGQTINLGECSGFFSPNAAFNILTDTVKIVFNDSIEELHIKLQTDTGLLMVPSVHNIFDKESWDIELIDEDRVEKVSYIITEADYQRAFLNMY